MSAIAVYFVFSYRLWRKPSHHIEVEDKSFVSFIYTYPTFRTGFCDRGPFSGCKLIPYCVPFVAFPMSVLAAYGLPLQSGNLFPSVLSKRDKLLPHGGEHAA